MMQAFCWIYKLVETAVPCTWTSSKDHAHTAPPPSQASRVAKSAALLCAVRPPHPRIRDVVARTSARAPLPPPPPPCCKFELISPAFPLVEDSLEDKAARADDKPPHQLRSEGISLAEVSLLSCASGIRRLSSTQWEGSSLHREKRAGRRNESASVGSTCPSTEK